VLDQKGILACNEAAVRLLHCRDKAEILSHHPSDLAPEILPDGRRSAEVAREKIATALQEGSTRFEWVHRRPDGSTFPSQVTLVPVEIEGRRLILSFWRDLTEMVALREEKNRAMAQLAGAFEASVGGIVDTMSSAAREMQTTAAAMASTAEETSRQSTAVASASEEASVSVQTVASATEELASSVGEISRQVSTSSAIASKAVAESERTDHLVKGLAEAAQKVGAVTGLIREIASQTNLLALNATIEAARAGEAGKGFAVVASEVKSLANQTGKATEEISAQIAAMQNATRDTVAAIQSIGTTIGQINEIATTIAAAVEEQGAATQEISRHVQQVAAGTREVSGNIAGVTQAAGETGAASGRVLSAAGELSRQGEELRTQVARFLTEVRAA
jgi:PAS domain S-box-containing protein